MMKETLRTTIILLLSVCLIITIMSISRAQAYVDPNTRAASWNQTQTLTTPWGATGLIGRFGPDFGYGEQGTVYQYRDPYTGSYISYSNTGMGMGLGGPLMGYGGMYSGLGAASYGPYAYGGSPQVQPTPGWATQGYASGGLFSPQTSFYQAQPGLFGMLGTSLGGFGGLDLGGFGGLDLGGFGGLGLGGFGLGGFGAWW